MRMIVENRVIKNEIFELRQMKKMSQEDLAKACNFSLYRIGSIERGEKVPTLLEAFIIAQFFNQEIQEVFPIHEC